MTQKISIPSQNQPFRRQSSLGGNVSFRNVSGNEDNSFVTLARVTKVYYKQGKIDFKLTNTNIVAEDSTNDGSGSAPIPVDFFGKRANGQVFGHYRPIKIGDLIAVAYLNGHKTSPIVIGVYPTSSPDYEIISPSFYDAGNDEDDSVAETGLAEEKVYPSMQTEYRSGSGTIAKALNGHSFLTIDDETTNRYNQLWASYDNIGFFSHNGEITNPLKEKAGDWLLVHEDNPNASGNGHRTRFYVNQDGNVQIVLMGNDSAGDISVFEGSRENGFSIKHYQGIKSVKSGDLGQDVYSPDFDSATKYVEMNIGKDESVLLQALDGNKNTNLSVKPDGVYINGKAISDLIYNAGNKNDQKISDITKDIDDINQHMADKDKTDAQKDQDLQKKWAEFDQKVQDNAKAASEAAKSAEQAGNNAKAAGQAAVRAGDSAVSLTDDIKNKIIYYSSISKEKDVHIPGKYLIINTDTYIANGTIKTAYIEDGAISSAKIGNEAVGTAQIAKAAVGTLQVADGAIGTAQIKDLAVTDEKVGNLTFNHMIGQTLDANKIKVKNISGDEISADTITANHLKIGKLSEISGDLGNIIKGRISAGDDPNKGVVIDGLDADDPNKYTASKKAALFREVNALNASYQATLDYAQSVGIDATALQQAQQAMSDGLSPLFMNMGETTTMDHNKVVKLEKALQQAISGIQNQFRYQLGTTANGKSTIYSGSQQPAHPKENDLWMKDTGSGTDIEIYNGAGWVSPSLNVVNNMNTALKNMPKTFFQSAQPDPKTTQLNEGDLWYKLTKDSNGNFVYTYYKWDNSVHMWVKLLNNGEVTNQSSIKQLQSNLEQTHEGVDSATSAIQQVASNASSDAAKIRADVAQIQNRVEQTAHGTQQTVANQQDQINDIKTDAAGIHETLTGQGNQIANINMTLNGLNTKYESVDKSGDELKNRLNNLSVGTRNLLHDTSDQYRTLAGDGRLEKSTASDIYTSVANYHGGDYFTYAATITNPSTKNAMLEVCLLDGNKNPLSASGQAYPVLIHSDSVAPGIWNIRENISFRITSNTWFIRTYVVFDGDNAPAGSQVQVKDERLVEGSMAGTWSPNPTDVADKITTNSTQINQNKKAITLKADQTTVDNLSGQVSQAQAQLKVQADQISSKVSSTDFKTLNDKVANMKISGRNLLHNLSVGTRNLLHDTSDQYRTLAGDGRLEKSTASDIYTSVANYHGGDYFTYAATITNPSTKNAMLEVCLLDGNKNPLSASGQAYPVLIHSDSVAPGIWNIRENISFRITSNTWFIRTYVVFDGDNAPAGSQVQVKDERLVEGSMAGTWSPNPTDVADKITTNSTQINQNKKAITLKADQTTVDNLSGQVSQAQAQLKVQADQISSKVSSTDFKTLNDKVANMKISGRNLLHNTSDQYKTLTGNGWLYATSASDMWTSTADYGRGQQFVYSATINNTSSVPIRLALYCYGANKVGQLHKATGITVNGGAFGKYSVMITIDKNTWFLCSDVETLDGQAPQFSIQVKDEKLEEGNVQTPWTPNPDDLITSISKNSTAIDQTNQQISLKADQTEVDKIKNTATQNSSRLNVMANEISSKVTSTDVNNIINGKGYATTSTVQSLITQKADSIEAGITDKLSSLNYGGLVLDKNGATLTSGNTHVYLNGTHGFQIQKGSSDIFHVDTDGNLTIKGDFVSANISGVNFTGANLNLAGSMKVSGSILAGDDGKGNAKVVINNGGLNMTSGDINLGDDKGTHVHIANDGTLTANQANISGNITATKLLLNDPTGNGQSSINLGGKFMVDSQGNVTANKFNSTNITVTGGEIKGTTIDSNTLKGNDINGGTITATNINSSTINGGTITGVTINGSNIVGGKFSSKDYGINGPSVVDYDNKYVGYSSSKQMPNFYVTPQGELLASKVIRRNELNTQGSYNPYMRLNSLVSVSDNTTRSGRYTYHKVGTFNCESSSSGIDIIYNLNSDADANYGFSTYNGTSKICFVILDGTTKVDDGSVINVFLENEVNETTKMIDFTTSTGTKVSSYFYSSREWHYLYGALGDLQYSSVYDHLFANKSYEIGALVYQAAGDAGFFITPKDIGTKESTYSLTSFYSSEISPSGSVSLVHGDYNLDSGTIKDEEQLMQKSDIRRNLMTPDSIMLSTTTQANMMENTYDPNKYYTNISSEGIEFSEMHGNGKSSSPARLIFDGDNGSNGVYHDLFGNIWAQPTSWAYKWHDRNGDMFFQAPTDANSNFQFWIAKAKKHGPIQIGWVHFGDSTYNWAGNVPAIYNTEGHLKGIALYDRYMIFFMDAFAYNATDHLMTGGDQPHVYEH